MREIRIDDPLETLDELMRDVRRQVEREQLYGDQPLAFRVVAAKDGSKSSSTNLMKHAERAERIRSAVFRVQLWTPRQEGFRIVTSNAGRELHENRRRTLLVAATAAVPIRIVRSMRNLTSALLDSPRIALTQ